MRELREHRSKVSMLMRRYQAEKLSFQILSQSNTLTAMGKKTDPVFLWVSKSWSDYLGWTEEELTNISFFELIHPEDVPSSLKAFSIFQETGQIGFKGETFINRYRCSDGNYKRVEWNNLVPTDGNEYMITANSIDDQ